MIKKEKNIVTLRLEAIKKLLQEVLIPDQSTFVKLLMDRYGIKTNQSILSRDLRKLKVSKKAINNQLFYSLPETNVIGEILKLAIVDIAYNESLIVIKTHPGLAAFVGDYIDQNPDTEILGCLAGENVVFITCYSTKKIEEIYHKLCFELNFKKKKYE